MDIYGEIKGIKYKPFLCRELSQYNIEELDKALSKNANFILKFNKSEIAVSWWVSPKRTRSYPYARVYDTLGFPGKRVTIIPVMKDEGRGENKKGCKGDRDFLQWDTVSLMSLLGVYVIIAYYSEAEKKKGCENRITNQKFDEDYIKKKIFELMSYQSDALHWNLEQIDKIDSIAEKALECYQKISEKLNVEMHSFESARRRIGLLQKGKEEFMNFSRKLAHEAQLRESLTKQPKEFLSGSKATITIKNYLGGYYYFTCDEVEIHRKELYLIEGKHTKTSILPSESDIKDGLIKMILFTNLENVKINDECFKPVPVLKLTTNKEFKEEKLSKSKLKIFNLLKKEAEENGFKIIINGKFVI